MKSETTGTPIETKIIHRKENIINGYLVDEFLINDQWLTFRAISEHPNHGRISITHLKKRWKEGVETNGEFLKTKKHNILIKSRRHFPKNGGRETKQYHVLGKWMMMSEIEKLEISIENNLTAGILIHRLREKNLTIERFFRLARPKKGNRSKDKWLREGLTDAEWNALKSGNNEVLLACGTL